jgi:transcriptional regulator with XRE-family HTH domain
VRELARAAGVHSAELSGWEQGSRVPGVTEVAVLLGQLRVAADERARLLELAAHAGEPNWLETTPPGALADAAAYVEYERTARALFTWQPILVPGLLQTPGYVRRIVTEPGCGREEIDRRTEIRLARQQRFHDRDPLTCTVLLGEAAIRLGPGGPAVPAGQLAHLLTAMERPNVGLRVLPTTEYGHPGMQGSFTILDFAELPPIVFLEHYQAGAHLYDQEQVAAYRAAAKSMTSLALSEDDSAQMLREVIADLEV